MGRAGASEQKVTVSKVTNCDQNHPKLKQGVNFLDDFDSSIEWKVQIDTGAARMVMHLRADDAEAQRYIAFDCSSEPQLDYVVLTPTFARDTIHHFKMVYTGTRTVAFYHDGTWLTNTTFSEGDWNGIDWVRPEWLVLGWSGYTNTISAALDYFTFASDDDDPPPSLTLNTEPTTTSGAENTITWNSVTDPGYGAVTYQAVRATNALFTTGLYTATGLVNPTTTFTGLTDSTTYYYRARAKDGLNNTTAWSNVVSSTQIVPPSGGEMSVRKYYYHGSQRVAMRQGNVVYYLHGDHLGSTSLTTSFTQSVVHEARYLPFGQERWNSGAEQTDFGFTGQRTESGFGLMDYNARYFSPRLGRFTAPDSIVPDFSNPQSLNRYSYVHNRPTLLDDPSGHCPPIYKCLQGNAFDPLYPLRDLWHYALGPDNPPPEEVPDGYSAFGAIPGVSGAGAGPVTGVEILYNRDSEDITFFAVLGGSLTPGVGASAKMQFNNVYQIGNDNLNYSGPFVGYNVTSAFLLGGTGGEAYSPTRNEGFLRFFSKDELSSYSKGAGPAIGLEWSLSVNVTEYIPVMTLKPDGTYEYHGGEYLFENENHWYIAEALEQLTRALGEQVGFDPDNYDWGELGQ